MSVTRNHGDIIRTCLLLLVASFIGPSDLLAQDLPAFCETDAKTRNQLQELGPVAAVGASSSSGLMAKSFPEVAANQMCLSQGNGFEGHYLFDFGTKYGFVKSQYEDVKPKFVIAIDYLHHASKSRKFDAQTREFIDREIAMLTLDCNHEKIDCSQDGKYYLAAKGGYRPVVILGDIYAHYAVDCSITDPFAAETSLRKKRISENRSKPRGCIEDYKKINEYIREKASKIPTLIVFSVDSFIRNLHRGLPAFYDIGGQVGGFYTDDLFWDGFHPWSEPGSQVIANRIIKTINDFLANNSMGAPVSIPYVHIDESHFKPFTGIVLVSDQQSGVCPGKYQRFISQQGEAYFSDLLHNIEIVDRSCEHAEVFDKTDPSLVEIAGSNPLVLTIKRVSKDGDIVITDKQWSTIQKVAGDPANRLSGGVVIALKEAAVK